MRRPDPSPPEVRAVTADRLQFLLGRSDRSEPPDRANGPAGDEELEDAPAGSGRAALVGPVFTRAHVTVVTVLVLLGLLGAGWALFRARPVAVAGPGAAVPVSTPASGAPGVPASATATATPGRAGIVVHVVGAVRRPGLVELTEGARVQDALDGAGGLTRAARPGRLNLAQLLVDGQQVVIGTARDPGSEVRDQAAPPAATAGSSAGPRGPSVMDLNRASQSELEQLPGVGPVTAAAIVSWRTQHGRFGTVAELQQVDGIGPKTYAQIAPHVRV